MSWQQELFGPTLETKNGTVATSDNAALNGADVVGVYFSAHWCPPCRGFTPVLAGIHKDCAAAGKKFEVVFMSSDRDEGSAKEYYGSMPWQMLPFSDRARKGQLSDKFGVSGIPTLVLLDGKTGKTMTTGGRGLVAQFGAAGFPWTEEAQAKAAAEKKAAKEKALVALKGLLSNNSKAGAAAVAAGAPHIIFWFSRSGDRGSSAVQPKINAALPALKAKGVQVLHVPFLDDSDSAGWGAINASAGLACITTDEMKASDGALDKAFKAVFEPQAPHIGMVNGTASSITHSDCVNQFYQSGVIGYPWTNERMAELKAEAEAKAAKIKAAMSSGKGMGFLGDKLLTKEGLKPTAEVIGDATIVALYFSAHWCPPCRGFTPQLAEKYLINKTGGKPFEIVFLSSDRDEGSFNEYYNEMPWTAVPFADRDTKNAISEALGVQGIPTLAMFDAKTGKLLTTEGRNLIDKPFPFGLNVTSPASGGDCAPPGAGGC